MIGDGVTPVASFGAGNIILGGGGSDIIEGRGGNDLIDGDARLNVQIGVYDALDVDHTGEPLSRHDSMTTLSADVFAGIINPGQLGIIRELVDTGHAVGINFDTAVFSDPFTSLFDTDGDNTTPPVPLNNYLIDPNGNGTFTVTHLLRDGDGTIIGTGVDGVDTLRGIERLQFADQSIVLGGLNNGPNGLVAISGTVGENQVLTASIAGVTDADNDSDLNLNPGANPRQLNPTGAITGTVAYFWQVELRPDTGVFEDIIIATGLGDLRATGTTFTPGDAEVGLRLRVRAVYQDANGVLETVFSAPTTAVENINDGPVGTVAISDTTPTETQMLTAITTGISDPDGLTAPGFTFQWEQANVAGVGGGASGFTPIAGATAQLFTPGAGQVNFELRVVVTYTDDQGTLETVTSAATTVVGDSIPANGLAQTLTGTEGQDSILGGGGIDTIFGLGENDIIDGGTGADTIFGGSGNETITGGAGADVIRGEAGNDLILYTIGDGGDAVFGDADVDTLAISGTTNNETLGVVFDGTVLTNFGGGSVADVEIITASLLGGTDTLSYAGTGGAVSVTVNLAVGTASGFTSIAGFENVTGGNGSDLLIGDAGANSLNGGVGGGNDTLVGGAGNDVLTGGAGTDTASYANETDAMFINLTTNSARRGLLANPVEDVLQTIENVEGGSGGDSIVGNNAANLLQGNGGADTLRGGTGNDSLIGGDGDDIFEYTFGDGADTVDGGAGLDTLNIIGTATANTLDVIWDGTSLTNFEGGTLTSVEAVVNLGGGTDTLTYAGSTSAVVVNLTTGTASGFSSVAGVENVTGGSNDDALTGNDANNTLSGGLGNDTLDGGANGTDTFIGGGGNDIYIVNSTADTVTEAGNGGTDTVFSSATTFTLSGNVENLTLTGIANINGDGNLLANTLTGNDGANVLSGGGNSDTLFGNGGADTLNGDAGSDVLVGGAGDDLMNGGANGDTFVFSSGFGHDTINGFDAIGNGTLGQQDLLNISAYDINSVAEFAARVSIVSGGNTVITIDGVDTITLNGVGAGVNQQDFIL
jgi:Ca2+-binding RTX toxin-like protein